MLFLFQSIQQNWHHYLLKAYFLFSVSESTLTPAQKVGCPSSPNANFQVSPCKEQHFLQSARTALACQKTRCQTGSLPAAVQGFPHVVVAHQLCQWAAAALAQHSHQREASRKRQEKKYECSSLTASQAKEIY